MNMRQDQIHVYLTLLIEEWEAGHRIVKQAGLPSLRMPNFRIGVDTESRFGQWDPERRMIEISENVLSDYPLSALREVMRHEIAHQMVSEIYKRDDAETAHGPTFRKACGVLGCGTEASSCEDILHQLDAHPDQQIQERIRKLLAHGNSQATTQAESQAFLEKASQLMLEHNLNHADLHAGELEQRQYVQRPVGKLFKRLPGYYHLLGNLLSDHYFVNYIQTCTRIRVGSDPGMRTRIELFGERGNVDAAEYVCHCLLYQAETLYASMRRQMRRPDKRSFFMGLFSGFSEKLDAQRNAREAGLNPSEHALILRESTHREEAYCRTYNIRGRGASIRYRPGEAHDLGQAAGRELHIPGGLKPDRGRKRLK